MQHETTKLANQTGDKALSNYHKDLVAMCLQNEEFRMDTVRVLEKMLYDLRATVPEERYVRVMQHDHEWYQKHNRRTHKDLKCKLNLEHWTTPKCSCEDPAKPLFTPAELAPLEPKIELLSQVKWAITLGKHTPKGPYADKHLDEKFGVGAEAPGNWGTDPEVPPGYSAAHRLQR